MDPPPAAGDYAQYLLHAKALVLGRPYADTGYIFTRSAPIAPVGYPPALPAALALSFRLFGRHVEIGRGLVLLSTVAFLIVTTRYFVVREGRLMAMATPLLTGIAVGGSDVSTQIVSDMPFCALCWGVVATADAPGR